MDFYDSDYELIDAPDITSTCLDFDIFPICGPPTYPAKVTTQQSLPSLNDEYLLDFLLDDPNIIDDTSIEQQANDNDESSEKKTDVQQPPTFVSIATQCNTFVPLVLPPSELPSANFYYNTGELLNINKSPAAAQPARISATDFLLVNVRSAEDDDQTPVLTSPVNSDGLHLCRQIHESRIVNGQRTEMELQMTDLVANLLSVQMKQFKRKLKRECRKMFGEMGEPKRKLVSALGWF